MAGSEPVAPADAIAASCAIPLLCRPVRIDKHRYVDGGIRSPTNGEVHDLDLTIVLSPMGHASDDLLIAAAVVATLLTVGWFFTARRVPENAASHESLRQDERSTTSDKLYAGSDRPAGPALKRLTPAPWGETSHHRNPLNELPVA